MSWWVTVRPAGKDLHASDIHMLRLQAWPIVLAKAQKAAAAVHKVSAGTGVVDVDTTAARLTAGEHCLWVSLSYLQFSQPRQCFGLSLAP